MSSKEASFKITSEIWPERTARETSTSRKKTGKRNSQTPKLTLKKDKENGEQKESKNMEMENTTKPAAIDEKLGLADTFKILYKRSKIY